MQFPLLCRSMYCGETDTSSDWCRNCSNRPELDAYRAWQKEQAAVAEEPMGRFDGYPVF